jgi:hypothetical protein
MGAEPLDPLVLLPAPAGSMISQEQSGLPRDPSNRRSATPRRPVRERALLPRRWPEQ